MLLLFGDDTELVLKRLSSNPELQLRYLKEVMRGSEHAGSSALTSEGGEATDTNTALTDAKAAGARPAVVGHFCLLCFLLVDESACCLYTLPLIHRVFPIVLVVRF